MKKPLLPNLPAKTYNVREKPIKVFPTKVKKPKQTANYYQCLLNASLNGFHGQPITSVCRNCKQNPTDLLAELT